jgi:trans-aconitate methyltransferase
MTSAANWNARLYNEKHSFVWKLAEDLLPLLSPERGERILDVGCGTGHLTSQIAASGAEVIGIDSSPQMVREAREKYPEIRFEAGDARDIRLDESFDAVFSNATLHWIREPERVIASIGKVLKPGGRFVAEFGGKGNIQGLIDAFFRSYATLGLHPPANANPWYYPSIGEYAQLLEAQGFEINQATLFDRPTPLEDGQRGLETWIRMFGQSFVVQLPEDKMEPFLREVECHSRAALFREDHWVLDYRRLRIRAGKPRT